MESANLGGFVPLSKYQSNCHKSDHARSDLFQYLRKRGLVDFDKLLKPVSIGNCRYRIGKSTCSFARSELNCRKPSSSAMNREDNLDAGGCRDCIDLFWSSSEFSRSCNCLLSVSLQRDLHLCTDLSLFLKVECVDLLQLAFLMPLSIYFLLQRAT